MSTETQSYPRPSLTADIIVLKFVRRTLKILLIERSSDPFKGRFALPGGFVDEHESPIEAAHRELKEETNIEDITLVDIGSFGRRGRDPRGWVVSTAFLGLASPHIEACAGDDASSVSWHAFKEPPPMAFDHGEIICSARQRLQELSATQTSVLQLLGPQFRTADARYLYSQIWDCSIDPRRFKAWLRRSQAVERVGPAKFTARPSLKVDCLR